MEEYTNLQAESEIIDDGSDLFLDGDDDLENEGGTVEEEETNEEGSEDGDEGGETSKPEKPEGSRGQTITVKYNGETKELTVEDGLAVVMRLREEGMSLKDAVKQVAKDLGLPKNQLYDMAVNHK